MQYAAERPFGAGYYAPIYYERTIKAGREGTEQEATLPSHKNALTGVPDLCFDALAIGVSYHHRRELYANGRFPVGPEARHSPVSSRPLVLCTQTQHQPNIPSVWVNKVRNGGQNSHAR